MTVAQVRSHMTRSDLLTTPRIESTGYPQTSQAPITWPQFDIRRIHVC
jgi:hypothetical protein